MVQLLLLVKLHGCSKYPDGYIIVNKWIVWIFVAILMLAERWACKEIVQVCEVFHMATLANDGALRQVTGVWISF